MVKINLTKKQESHPEEPNAELIDEVTPSSEMSSPAEEEAESTGKKGGALKYILLILFAVLTTGSAYFLYTKGWSLKDINLESAKSLIFADESSDEVSKTKAEATKKKTPKQTKKTKSKKKLSTLNLPSGDDDTQKAKPKQKKKKKPVPKKIKEVSKSVKKGVVSKVSDGRILLDVFKSIVTSIDEESGDLKLTVSNSRVTLAVSLNSRAEAATLLRKIRQKWPLSNLRAVRFEQSNNLSSYNFATQFDGSINTAMSAAVSNNGMRRVMKLSEFKKLLSENISRSGLTLSSLETKKGVKSKTGTVIPMVITAEGSNDSIVLFMDSLMNSNASYTVSRASIISKDDAVSKMSIYLSLNNGSDKARS